MRVIARCSRMLWAAGMRSEGEAPRRPSADSIRWFHGWGGPTHGAPDRQKLGEIWTAGDRENRRVPADVEAGWWRRRDRYGLHVALGQLRPRHRRGGYQLHKTRRRTLGLTQTAAEYCWWCPLARQSSRELMAAAMRGRTLNFSRRGRQRDAFSPARSQVRCGIDVGKCGQGIPRAGGNQTGSVHSAWPHRTRGTRGGQAVVSACRLGERCPAPRAADRGRSRDGHKTQLWFGVLISGCRARSSPSSSLDPAPPSETE